MNVVVWSISAVLALAFLAAGVMKIARSKASLASAGMGWVDDFPAGAVKAIGTLEVLGAIGLIVPALLDVATVLAPLAALGLALMMAGAAVVHARRHEYRMVGVNAVLLLLAVVVAWGRFSNWS